MKEGEGEEKSGIFGLQSALAHEQAKGFGALISGDISRYPGFQDDVRS